MTMKSGRREFLIAGGTLAALAALPASVRAAAAGEPRWNGYANAIVIDSCGSPGRADFGEERKPLDAAELADMRASGLSAMNFTVGSVGRYANDYEDTIKNIAYWD